MLQHALILAAVIDTVTTNPRRRKDLPPSLSPIASDTCVIPNRRKIFTLFTLSTQNVGYPTLGTLSFQKPAQYLPYTYPTPSRNLFSLFRCDVGWHTLFSRQHSGTKPYIISMPWNLYNFAMVLPRALKVELVSWWLHAP
jgi:hypothetical protein